MICINIYIYKFQKLFTILILINKPMIFVLLSLLRASSSSYGMNRLGFSVV